MINYVKGDATSPRMADGANVICHVTNDIGAWGAGFSGAVSRRWPEPEQAYRRSARAGTLALGKAEFIQVSQRLYVANMCAQHSIGRTNPPPIRYGALEQCLEQAASKAAGGALHMPRIGCGLAGGKWAKVEPIIERATAGLCDVFVYDLK